MGIGIFNKLKRIGRGFISGIKGIFKEVIDDPKVKETINTVRNDVINVVKNEILGNKPSASYVLDKNKLLKGLSTETDSKPLVSFASRKWIPKFKQTN